MQVSLTKRKRNSALQFLTAHDVNGFANQQWWDLAQPGAVAAVYMGKKAAAFFRGRLLMHGAASNMPVTIVENASRLNQRILQATLMDLPEVLATSSVDGPVVLLVGLAPRGATKAMIDLNIAYMEYSLCQKNSHPKF